MTYANKNAKNLIFVKYTLQNSQKLHFTYSRLGIFQKNVLSLHKNLTAVKIGYKITINF